MKRFGSRIRGVHQHWGFFRNVVMHEEENSAQPCSVCTEVTAHQLTLG